MSNIGEGKSPKGIQERLKLFEHSNIITLSSKSEEKSIALPSRKLASDAEENTRFNICEKDKTKQDIISSSMNPTPTRVTPPMVTSQKKMPPLHQRPPVKRPPPPQKLSVNIIPAKIDNPSVTTIVESKNLTQSQNPPVQIPLSNLSPSFEVLTEKEQNPDLNPFSKAPPPKLMPPERALLPKQNPPERAPPLKLIPPERAPLPKQNPPERAPPPKLIPPERAPPPKLNPHVKDPPPPQISPIKASLPTTSSPKQVIPPAKFPIMKVSSPCEVTSSEVVISPTVLSSVRIPPSTQRFVALTEKTSHPPPPPPPPPPLMEKLASDKARTKNDSNKIECPPPVPPPPPNISKSQSNALVGWATSANNKMSNSTPDREINEKVIEIKRPPPISVDSASREFLGKSNKTNEFSKKKSQNHSGNSSSSPEDDKSDESDEDDDLPNYSWYFDVSKSEATHLMRGCEQLGNFMVRPSDDNQFVLMVRADAEVVKKFKIQPHKNGWVLGDPTGCKRIHSSIISLINFYRENGVKVGNSNLKLKDPVSKD